MMKRICTWITVALLSTSYLACSQPAVPTSPKDEGDRHFETLVVGDLSFEDVWVHRQTNAVILIRHSMGIHSIKLSDLPSDELEELKAQVGDLAEVPEEKPRWQSNTFVQKIMAMFYGSGGQTKTILVIVGGLALLLLLLKAVGKRKTLPT